MLDTISTFLVASNSYMELMSIPTLKLCAHLRTCHTLRQEAINVTKSELACKYSYV